MHNLNTLPTKISGIDVSAYQGNVDWQRVKQAGTKFVFIKATEGSTFKDKAFVSNVVKASDAGLFCGAYHFFRPKAPVKTQVDNFVSLIRYTNVKLLPALDVEVPGDWMDIPRGDRTKLIVEWLEQVELAINVQPVIYLSSSFPGDVLSNTDVLLKYSLWLAHYTEQPAPKVPYPWQKYIFWQHSDRGLVDGIKGNVDLNWFNGSIVELEQVMHQQRR